MKFNFDDVYYPADVTERIHENTDEKMIDHIRRANIDHMDEVAMTYMGVEITYSELFSRIEDYARALKQAGLKKGDFITICLPNSPETVYYFYACNDIGATPYLIDPRCTFGKMKICVDDSKSKLFVCEMGTYFDKVAGNENELPVQKIVVVSPVSTLYDYKKLSFKLKLAKIIFNRRRRSGLKKHPGSDLCVFHKEFVDAGKTYSGKVAEEYDPDIPAIVVNTSGTSGDSVKGAVHSNRSYNIFINQISTLFQQVKRRDTFYGYIPFFSMYGSSTGLHAPFCKGAILDLIPKFDGIKSIRDVLKKKSNVLIGVPSLYDKLIEESVKNKTNMSFAKLYVIGGDNMSPDKLANDNEILTSIGIKHKLVYGYGTTEVMMISTTSDDERSHVFGSSGALYPNVSVRILDPGTGKTLNYQEEGEVYVHTPTMMLGYLNKPEENSAVFFDIEGTRFFKTGDKGYLTETGHLFLTGRYKRLMKRPDGHQVSPIPIENSICSHDSVENAVVVGVRKSPDAPGVIPTAFVKLKDGHEVTTESIKSIIETSLRSLSGEREMALAYRIVDRIPMTENGKMDYRTLEKNDFGEGTYYAIDDPITRDYFKGMSNVSVIKIQKS